MKKNNFGNRLFLGLIFLFLYAPIFVLIVFSFNATKSRTIWGGFSLQWYVRLFQDLSLIHIYTAPWPEPCPSRRNLKPLFSYP